VQVPQHEIWTRGGSTTTDGEERSNKKAVAPPPVEVSPRDEKCEKSLSQLCCGDGEMRLLRNAEGILGATLGGRVGWGVGLGFWLVLIGYLVSIQF
jgi:hypothetical protein